MAQMIDQIPVGDSPDDQLSQCGAFAYDIEIVSAIPMQGEIIDPNLHYCSGWEDYGGMGISVVTAYDFVDRAYRVFLQDNLDELRTLINSRHVLIGFNSKRFDNNVLASNKIHVPEKKCYDLWVHTVATQPEGHRRGYNLASLLEANGLQSKSGLGSEAPKWVQTGQWGRCINYCMDDTRLMVQLVRLACADMMRSPKDGKYMNVRKPWQVIEYEAGLFQ